MIECFGHHGINKTFMKWAAVLLLRSMRQPLCKGKKIFNVSFSQVYGQILSYWLKHSLCLPCVPATHITKHPLMKKTPYAPKGTFLHVMVYLLWRSMYKNIYIVYIVPLCLSIFSLAGLHSITSLLDLRTTVDQYTVNSKYWFICSLLY